MNLLNLIQKKKILVAGDVMLDTYFSGEVNRISPEAPVPVFHKLGQRCVPGGAANVAVNLAAASQAVSVLSLIADDQAGRELRKLLTSHGIDCGLLVQGIKHTTQKIRFIAENNQQVLRLDEEDRLAIDRELENKLLERIAARIDEFDIIVLSDYNKGLLTESFTQAVIQLAKEHGIYTLVDVKGASGEKYREAYLLKPNLAELRLMTQMPVDTEEEILSASRRLLRLCQCKHVLVTRGAEGMLLVSGDQFYIVEADDHEVFDVTGAGDTAIAYLAASLASGLPLVQAVEIANHAAGLQVTKAGTSAIGLREVSEVISENARGATRKLLDREGASQLRKLWADKQIVFTNGCFDILHVGHIRYLRQAAELGDLLVIGLNSDASVRRLKGEGRPINSEEDRAELLASLEFVDYIVIFDEDTPYTLIQEVQPDVLVKGGDYTLDEVVGRDIVQARGGDVILLNFVEGKSTSGIIQRIRHEG